MANAEGRWDGAEKAQRHRELCEFYVSCYSNSLDRRALQKRIKAVHEATQVYLTDKMDEVIGFPLTGRPEYDSLAKLFFEYFHDIACRVLEEQTAAP